MNQPRPGGCEVLNCGVCAANLQGRASQADGKPVVLMPARPLPGSVVVRARFTLAGPPSD